jgi:catechol 2,3-dioxygenase-like lactoylglutathione lyase family enzyme
MSASTGLKIGSVVIDCINFDRMLEFWQEALHYIPRQPAEGGWMVLLDPDGRNTSVSLNQVQPSEKLTGRNWLHFDLYTNEQEKEVTRLLALGAKRHPQEYDPEDDFVVLEDPDGNLFCVVQLGHNLRNTDPI